MTVIDKQGRVLGRVNLVDALLVALAVAAVPLAYAGYVLFREPAPRLTAVVPALLKQAPPLQVEIHGEHFRPYLRASVGDQQGQAFVFVSPTVAVVPLPALAPGTYDVVLYDYMREVSRLPQALTIAPPPAPPTTRVTVTGAITGLTLPQVEHVKVGLQLPVGNPIATVTAVEQARTSMVRINMSGTGIIALPTSNQLEVPVTVSLDCVVQMSGDGLFRCAAAGMVLAPNVNLSLLSSWGHVNLWIERIAAPAGAAVKP